METTQDILLATLYPENHELKVGTTEITPHDIHCPVCHAIMKIDALQTEEISNEDTPLFRRVARNQIKEYQMRRLNLQHLVKMSCPRHSGVELTLTFDESWSKLQIINPYR
jgi:hypothetical protein